MVADVAREEWRGAEEGGGEGGDGAEGEQCEEGHEHERVGNGEDAVGLFAGVGDVA